jgi:DNA-binding transcriptional LysR family regulator
MDDIRKVDLNLLVVLNVLLEERNVSRAAARLALTQPTVSGMLSRLRDLFDDPLFVRTQRGMLPTPRAQALLPALTQLLADASALVAPQEFDPLTSERVVTISVNDYMQSCLVVPFVRVLRGEAPHMRLVIRHLEVADLSPMLARGQIDMAITIPAFADPALHFEKLYREEYVGVVRREHPIGRGKIPMNRFLAYDHVLVSPANGASTGPTDDVLASMGRQRRVALTVPSFLVLKEVLQTDDLIALIPERLLERDDERLRPIRLPLEVPGFDVISVWHNRTHQDPALRWVRERLSRLADEQLT